MSASSPLSSTSSLSDSTPNPDQVAAGPAGPVPSVHSTSLPHKLRHKAKHVPLESEPPNHSLEFGGGEALRSPLCNVEQLLKHEGGSSSLKQESDVLRSELHRLAGEVASLKTLLAPGPSGESRKRADSFADHQDTDEMDSEEAKDLTMTEDEQTVKSSCESAPEENQQ